MKVGMIGCGKMGGGIAQRLSLHHELFLYDHHQESTKTFASQIKAASFNTAKEAIAEAETVLIAVKPQGLAQLAKEIYNDLRPEQWVVSCLAGTTVQTLKAYFPKNCVLRIMPNLSVIHGEGIVGLVETDEIDQEAKDKISHLFSSLGSIHWVPEMMIDAISSLTGSGPAFVSVMIESMIEAGVAMGIRSTLSKELVFQLITGTVSTLKATGKDPAQLKLDVASPGGTTIAGLITMEDEGIRAGIIHSFLSTYYRNLELSKQREYEIS